MPSRAATFFALGLLLCTALLATVDRGPAPPVPEPPTATKQPVREPTRYTEPISWSSLAPRMPVAEKTPGPRTFKARRQRRRERREKATREVVLASGPTILEPVSSELLPRPAPWPAPAGTALTAYERELWRRGTHANPDDDEELLLPETTMTRTIDRRTASWSTALQSVDPSFRPAAEIVLTDALVVMSDIENAMLDGSLNPGDAFSQLGAVNEEALASLSEVLPEYVADRIRFELTRR